METIGADLAEMKPVPLAAAHIEAVRGIGSERSYAAGDMIARLGDPMDRFLYVVEGKIEVLDSISERRMGDFTLGSGQFVGELSFLSGGNYCLAMRAVSRTVTLRERGIPEGFLSAATQNSEAVSAVKALIDASAAGQRIYRTAILVT